MKKAVLVLLLMLSIKITNAESFHSLKISKPLEIFKSFVKWYVIKRHDIDINYPIEMHPGDSTKLYKLNYKRLNLYIKDLKNSGYFSANFLKQRRIYYENIQLNLLKTPQWDGFVLGHEFDDLFDTSELDIIGVKNLKFVLVSENVKSNNASIICKISGYKFSAFFIKSNGKWHIEKL